MKHTGLAPVPWSDVAQSESGHTMLTGQLQLKFSELSIKLEDLQNKCDSGKKTKSRKSMSK